MRRPPGRLPMQETREAEAPPNPAFPVVVGLLLPWLLFLAAFAPRAWWAASVALLAILGILLLVGARWAHQEAQRQDLDASWWATLTVLTLGSALLILAGKGAARAAQPGHLQFVCGGCGRLGDLREPFCYACGEAG